MSKPLLAALLLAASLLFLRQQVEPSPLPTLRLESRLFPMAGCGFGCRI